MGKISEIFESVNDEDFAKMMEESLQAKDSFRIGDKVVGRFAGISGDTAFVDISGKSEAMIDVSEFTNDKGEITVNKGDEISAYVVSVRGGEIRLTSKIGRGSDSANMLAVAYRHKIPVEGKVTSAVKGGFAVTVANAQAFCPRSLIDIRQGDDADYIGKTFLFNISEYSERGKNIVLSRKEILEKQRKQKESELKQTLNVGDKIKGTVASVQNFGIFIDLGGVQALVPRSELSWARNVKPTDYSVGDTVEAIVDEMDWENDRLSLSMKKISSDPWKDISMFPKGSTTTGQVTNFIKAGAFVELRPGIEGFLHISKMNPTKRITAPEEAVSLGDTVSVRIIDINEKEKKISLELLTSEPNPWDMPASMILNTVQQGVIERITGSGADIRLNNGMLGFAPKEKLAAKGGDINKDFPVGADVAALVIQYNPDERKLTLSVRDAAKKLEQDELNKFGNMYASSNSTLGDLFKDKFAELKQKVEK